MGASFGVVHDRRFDASAEAAHNGGMKAILQLMAQYNRTANTKLYTLLAGVDPHVVSAESGSYFGGILGLLNHVLLSDLGWFVAFRDSDLDLPVLQSPVLDFENPGWRKNLYANLTDLRPHRESMDELIIALAAETPEPLFLGDIRVTHWSGQVRSFPFGKVLMHLFNHQTHHRGAISQILDQNSVENDYSNLHELLLQD